MEVVVTGEHGEQRVRVRWRDSNHGEWACPESLALLPEENSQSVADPVAASQACLNELAAAVIRAAPGGSRHAAAAIRALREHNWAAGLPFEGTQPGMPLQSHSMLAVGATQALDADLTWERRAAEDRAEREALWGPVSDKAVARLLGPDPGAPALVYLAGHASLGAVKVGVSDPGGARIAQHQRRGWHLVTAFRVTAAAAREIEASVLDWWRADLRLPSFLIREQMPQGGWTETVAMTGIDLDATVARICERALLPGSQPLA